MDLAISTTLDLLLVAILGVSIFLGVRRGLIRSIISLVGSIVALVLALIFSSGLGGYIDANYVNAPMRAWVIDQLSASAQTVSATDLDFDDLFENQPEFFTETCDFLGVEINEMKDSYQSLKTEGVEHAKSAIVTEMVDPLSALISRVIAFAVIFLAAMILIVVISMFSKFLNNLPIVRKMDKLGGGILGVVTGILISFIVVAIISTGSKYVLRDRSPAELESIKDKTVVYKVFHDLDPLTRIFETTTD
ncbi:MAG: CvpA family protein [Clostridia bacterium]|nr:CvpA family protein [Clostridia bacterium]